MRYIALAALTAVLPVLQAQGPVEIRQATMRGQGGPNGKCTIEVRVDMAAEVDVYGDSGRLRTLAGQPATWTRMECSGPLPYNMADFRFRGIDGRGDVRLVQDPRNNNGMAVIRIDDPRSGSEGYTFDLEWAGGSGDGPTGGFRGGFNTPGGGGGGGRRPDRGMPAERAIDICRTEVRERAAREYNMRGIDITGINAEPNFGRGSSRVAGTFADRAMPNRRGGGYRFTCDIDPNAGQVRAIEILRPDGSVLRPGNQPGGFDPRAVRECQDAVVARVSRDGYRNPNFTSTGMDPNRNAWISGTLTASRGPVADNFDFGCQMDPGRGTVRNVQVNRR
jgi:hypothetical protein